MSIPTEFTVDAVAAQVADDSFRPYHDFMHSGEPLRSILDANPWLQPPTPGEDLQWGKGYYYDTTVARKHPYWKSVELPSPTKNMNQLRKDLFTWGYCLVEEGLSASQCRTLHRRVAEQADGERQAGMAYISTAFQIVWTLINKGRCFVQCLEFDPEMVQAGPLIEALLDETLGEGWYNFSFTANMAFPGCCPQGLHQDQGMLHPWQTPEAPVLVNTMYMLQDVDDQNGGTLIIPGSHKLISEAGSGKAVGELPPTINLEARAGTIMLFDGRMLHGTGANRTDRWRYVMTQANVKPWIRQQENWAFAVRTEVLEQASDKLLQRIGLQATYGYGMVEGYGMLGSGLAGDSKGSIVKARLLIDAGEYQRLGELDGARGRALARGEQHVSLQDLQVEEGRE